MSSTNQQVIQIRVAAVKDAALIADMIHDLLMELEPEHQSEISQMPLTETSQRLLEDGKVWALIANIGSTPVGILTLHECAAIYAGGLFGEVSELYVKPQFRSGKVGEALLNYAMQFGAQKDWQRLEVGIPDPGERSRTHSFYCSNEFQQTGARLRRLINAPQ